MAKRFISKRVLFQPGKQKDFLNQSKKIIGLSWVELARLLKISNRTLTDWKREKFLMSLGAVKFISKKAGLKFPKNVEVKNPFWYVYKGAKIGGFAVYKKYGYIGGDPERRKRKWYEWWEREGKFRKHPIINVALPIKKPKKSEELAEFVGIEIGDGGISKNQLTITLNFKDDKEYIKFVVKLIKKLFGVKPSIYHSPKDSVDNIVVSRTELVKFCTEKLGLKIGNKVKQQIDIPDWIKRSRNFQIACVRGLVDTDGCIFTHSYKVNGKLYSYKKLAFSSRSKPLTITVYRFLKRLGFSPRFTKDGKDVRIESKNDVQKYFQIIDSHNPKHLKKYRN